MRVRVRETEIETDTDIERERGCRQATLTLREKQRGIRRQQDLPTYSHLRRENHVEKPTKKHQERQRHTQV